MEEWERKDYYQSEESDVDDEVVLETLKAQSKLITESDAMPELEYSEEEEIDFSTLTSDEKAEIIKRDSPELLHIFKIYKELLQSMDDLDSFGNLTEKGEEYVKIKKRLLGLLGINISFYIYLKSIGKNATYHPVVSQIKDLYRTLMKEPAQIQNDTALVDTVHDKRKADKDILKHKGIQKKRKKIERNVRVKNKQKYIKKVHKRRATYGYVERDKPINYEGEATGIKKNLVKSTKF